MLNEAFTAPSSVDVGIIIALKEEFSEFYKEIKSKCKPIKDPETGRYYYQFEYARADYHHTYQCVASFVGDMGSMKAGLMTQRFLSQWKPPTLVMLGIAAGLNKDARLGDVVIASQVDAYLENSKAVPTTDPNGYTFLFGGEVYRSRNDLLHMVQNFEFVHQNIYQDWQAVCARELRQLVSLEVLEKLINQKLLREQIQIIEGPVASGPMVGASQTFTEWLKTRNRKYLALEMETAGLMAAVYEEADPKRTLILRAISDYGDERKGNLDEIGDGALRRYAMHNAIQLLWKLFDAEIFFKEESAPSSIKLGHVSFVVNSGAHSPAKAKVKKDTTTTTQVHTPMETSKPPRSKAFIAYSHKDKRFLDELHTYLTPYERTGLVDFWDDTRIAAGAKWHDEIRKALQSAKVAILLVSADFLASDFIASNELPYLLDAADHEGITILSVNLRPSAFKDTELAHFQAVNVPSNPLSGMSRSKREEIWSSILSPRNWTGK